MYNKEVDKHNEFKILLSQPLTISYHYILTIITLLILFSIHRVGIKEVFLPESVVNTVYPSLR
jgi:hypothetical protein